MPYKDEMQGSSMRDEMRFSVFHLAMVLLASEHFLTELWCTLQIMFLKYQLPSEPSVYVDLLDDEDVSLMFDEVPLQPVQCFCNPFYLAGLSPACLALGRAWQSLDSVAVPGLTIQV